MSINYLNEDGLTTLWNKIKALIPTAGTGLSYSGKTLNHSNSITAGTVGSTTAISTGSTVTVPYLTYDAQGHITVAGTHQHIVPASQGGDSNITATVANGTLILTIDTTVDGTEVAY